MKTDERAAWEALQAALTAYTPRCAGDTRFIADDLTDTEEAYMAGICDRCPISDLCDAYAAHVKAGFWAGRNRLPKGQRT